jgi:hypothetical protein
LPDKDIDKHYKEILKDKANGFHLPMDIISHLEYFYNTLLMSNKIENPFLNSQEYPALLFEENTSPGTLLEKHRKVIFP